MGLKRMNRIAKAGLIDRSDFKGDGRGQIIRITSKGRKTRRAMWPVYGNVLSKSIEQSFTPAEASRFGALVRKIANVG